MGLLRFLVWAYLLLLLAEGALRKWVFPGLSTELLIVRDPVAVALCAVALQRGVFPFNGWILGAFGITTLALAASFAFTDLPWTVVLFGWRTFMLHLPVLFIVGAVFDREDVRAVGRLFLWLAPAMAVLVFLQFTTPVDSYWNRSAGGGEAMKSAFDRARATATFSFSPGLAAYVGCVTAFLVWGILDRGTFTVRALAVGAAGLLVILALSASRSVILGAAMVAPALALAAVRKPRYIPALAAGALALGGAWLLLGQTEVVDAGMETHRYRFGAAGAHEGSTLARVVSFFIPDMHALTVAPWHGLGLGIGTNAGAALLTGTRGFLVAEGEFERTIFEMGPILGLAMVLLRYGLAVWLLLRSWLALRDDNPLPLLLWGAGVMGLCVGQWGVATNLGFGVLVPGLCLAALRVPEEPADADEEEGEEPDPA